MLAKQAKDLFGLDLTDEQVAKFDTYAAELAEWNTRMNLTAITEPQAVRVRHFLDSLSVASGVPLESGMRVIDIGTGAGFPGLALHIGFDGLRTILLDSTGKKITFLEHITKTLNLADVKAVKMRAEEAGQHPQYRAQQDLVLARAVARLPGLVEYMLPLAHVGGVCVALKGETAYVEADDSLTAIEVMGGQLRDIVPVELPDVPDTHFLVVIEKVKKTPKTYPRAVGVPTRDPIMVDEDE